MINDESIIIEGELSDTDVDTELDDFLINMSGLAEQNKDLEENKIKIEEYNKKLEEHGRRLENKIHKLERVIVELEAANNSEKTIVCILGAALLVTIFNGKYIFAN